VPNVLLGQERGPGSQKSGNSAKWVWYFNGSRFGFHFADPNTSVLATSDLVDVDLKQWHLLTVCINEERKSLEDRSWAVTFYVDGTAAGKARLEGMRLQPVFDIDAPLTIGSAGGRGFLDAAMDEIRIFVYLSDSDVRNLYENTKPNR
jgi:hypothetical protein